MASNDRKLEYKPIPVTGRWRPVTDGTQLGDGDFQTLTNMRYTDTGIKSVRGMTKINTNTVNATYSYIKSGIYFKKNQPSESHVLVQASNIGGTGSAVYDNTIAIPGTGDFTVTTVHADTAGADVGQFVVAPDGAVAYCNSKDTSIWTGAEGRVAAFFIGDSAGATVRDYSSVINNTLSDAANVATMAVTAGTCYCFIGCLRPVKGFKFYVGTINTATAAATVAYWNGTTWTTVGTQDDNTSLGDTKTLGIAGGNTISFDTTVSIANRKFLNNTFLYWYRISFVGIDATTTVYYVTVDAPFQSVKDIWDGVPRTIDSFYRSTAGSYDDTTKVLANDYVDLATETYSVISDLTTSQYLYCGFVERMCALTIIFGSTYVNATASTAVVVSYWNGTAWTAVTGQADGTISNSRSFNQNGTISWVPPSEISEFKYSLGRDYLYYYRIAFTQIISAQVYLDYITGIPAEKTILGYKFPLVWQDRLGLGCEKSHDRNMLWLSSANTNCVFNGSDSCKIYFGDDTELTAGGSLFARYGSDIYENMIICKADEVYLIDGTTPSELKKYRLGRGNGCVASGTFKICNLGYEIAPGINKQIALWQSATGVMLFDGATLIDISGDVHNYFDKNKTECINTTYVHKSRAFYDERSREYHLLVTSSSATTHDVELVFDLMRKKWFKIDRGTNNYLQCGFEVTDLNGDKFVYGGM